MAPKIMLQYDYVANMKQFRSMVFEICLKNLNVKFAVMTPRTVFLFNRDCDAVWPPFFLTLAEVTYKILMSVMTLLAFILNEHCFGRNENSSSSIATGSVGKDTPGLS